MTLNFTQLLILTGVFLAFQGGYLVLILRCLSTRAKSDRQEIEAIANKMADNCHNFHRELNEQTLIGFTKVTEAMNASTKALTDFLKQRDRIPGMAQT
jgi:hypothetical protein